MKQIKQLFWLILLLTTALWWLADSPLLIPFDLLTVTNRLTQYTGVIAIIVMSCSMILATRPTWLERYIGGLDKGYRLHKWFGISAVLFAIGHWLLAEYPEWLGWRDATHSHLQHTPTNRADALHQWFIPLARWSADYGFEVFLLVAFIAISKRFGYSLFLSSHFLMTILYLLFALHSVVVMDASYFSQPIGWVTVLFIGTGMVATLIVVFERVGRSRKARGEVIQLTPYPQAQMLEITLQMDKHWQGHKAGQFAFVTFNVSFDVSSDKYEAPHPFTISSAWQPQTRQIRFIIKQLGDFTSTLADTIKVGDQLWVEGGYGQFDFDEGQSAKSSNQAQIWIAGGVGITPFLARMEDLQLAQKKLSKKQEKTANQRIDFFYSARQLDPNFKQQLQEHAKSTGVNLYLFPMKNIDRVSGATIRKTVRDWQMASVWFCGAKEMGESIKNDLIANGLPANAFKQELFEMR